MQKRSVSNAKTATIILLSLVLIAVLVGASTNYPPDVWFDDLPSQYTYTVEGNSTYFWATRHNGLTQYASTNASYTFNNALSQKNVSVFVSPGNYSITQKIELRAGQSLIGGSWTNTILYQAGSFTGSILVNKTGERVDGSIISGLYLNGNSSASAGTGISLFTFGSSFRHLRIDNFKTDGIKLRSFGSSFSQRSYENMLYDNILKGNTVNINLEQYSSDNQIYDNIIKNGGAGVRAEQNTLSMIRGNHFVGNTINIYSLSGGHKITDNYMDSATKQEIYLNASSQAINNVQILNNKFLPEPQSNNTYPVILLRGYAGKVVTFIDIEGNNFKNDEATKNTYILQMQTNTANITFRNNQILPQSYNLTLVNGGNGTALYEGNRGYNPVGYITNPISSGYVVDSGSGGFVNNTEYTIAQSPKLIAISVDGTLIAVYVDGQQITATSEPVIVSLAYGQTLKIVWSVAPTIKVFGQ